MQIVSSEMCPTKDGGGQYLWLELDALEGPLMGRKLFDRLNLVNASAQTVEIATQAVGDLPRGRRTQVRTARSCT